MTHGPRVMKLLYVDRFRMTERQARTVLSDDQLDALHALKRRLSRLGRRITIADLLREGADLVVEHHRDVTFKIRPT